MPIEAHFRCITVVLAVVLVCASGCGSEAPRVVLGTGEDSFAALQPGDSIAIVLGPQNGYHFVGSLRLRGLEAGTFGDRSAANNPTIRFSAFDLDRGDERVDRPAEIRQGLKPIADDEFELLGRKVVLDIQDDSELDGQQIRFAVEVVDALNERASHTLTLVAIPGEFNR